MAVSMRGRVPILQSRRALSGERGEKRVTESPEPGPAAPHSAGRKTCPCPRGHLETSSHGREAAGVGSVGPDASPRALREPACEPGSAAQTDGRTANGVASAPSCDLIIRGSGSGHTANSSPSAGTNVSAAGVWTSCHNHVFATGRQLSLCLPDTVRRPTRDGEGGQLRWRLTTAFWETEFLSGYFHSSF